MLTQETKDAWPQFIEFAQERCSATEFANWIAPIKVLEASASAIVLEVPNIFVQEYLLSNYKKDLLSFLPVKANGEPSIEFVIAAQPKKSSPPSSQPTPPPVQTEEKKESSFLLNPQYTFPHFIEGPANQFVKSVALGVAMRPSKSYNPLFIHGGVGLGKTHLLHAIGHTIQEHHKKLRMQYITTEGFINDLVDHLKNRSTDKMKRFYRNLDVLLVDDIQFLQNRLNFEEEICNTFEALIQQNKQIVITSDKPPSQLKLSERMIARMEWGLVAHIGPPDFETRVAILQHKAEQKGIRLPQKISYFLAEQIFNNVRQLEGALNRLSAYSRLMNQEITEDIIEQSMGEMIPHSPQKKVSADQIIKSVATLFEIKASDLCSEKRDKKVALPRQVAMYLAKELLTDSLMKIAQSFGGKSHSTLLHSWKKISRQLQEDDKLKRQIQLARRNIET